MLFAWFTCSFVLLSFSLLSIVTRILSKWSAFSVGAMSIFVNNQKLNLDTPTAACTFGSTETVLQFLRRNGLTGTKEGCASGDCGACTVMAGTATDGEIEYRTINACIAPIGQYVDQHLVTVEGLASNDDLHPAQQAMVACHGSQCGFCTPGFVMSLAAMVEYPPQNIDAASVREGISGNLCRCTGYRPIVEAGLQALKEGSSGIVKRLSGETALNNISESSATSVLRPNNFVELNLVLNEAQGAKLIAGGTDLMLEVTQRYQQFPLIDVTGVQQMQVLAQGDSETTIGAAVSYTRLEAFFAERSPETVKLLHRLGSRQIRNNGTVGGNLANGSPIADMPPILLVWDAVIEVGASNGSTRQVPVSDFYKGYRQTVLGNNEYIISVSIPNASMARFHRFYKNSKRIEDDISAVMGAFSFQLEEGVIVIARVAFGGMAATPVRLEAVESVLVGQACSDKLIENATLLAGELLKPMTDVRASADYRSAMALQMLVKALRQLNGEPLIDITEIGSSELRSAELNGPEFDSTHDMGPVS
ncbi:MAG: xanthine dehydrogenase small subunit [Patiriisocius sp.]